MRDERLEIRGEREKKKEREMLYERDMRYEICEMKNEIKRKMREEEREGADILEMRNKR